MFSKRKDYENYVKDTVKKVLLLCDQYRIPVFITLAVEDNDQTTKYETEMLSSAAVNTPLTEDHLAKHAAILSGFDVVPFASEFQYEEEVDVISNEEMDQIRKEKGYINLDEEAGE